MAPAPIISSLNPPNANEDQAIRRAMEDMNMKNSVFEDMGYQCGMCAGCIQPKCNSCSYCYSITPFCKKRICQRLAKKLIEVLGEEVTPQAMCGQCPSCLLKDCESCVACLDKKFFGGRKLGMDCVEKFCWSPAAFGQVGALPMVPPNMANREVEIAMAIPELESLLEQLQMFTDLWTHQPNMGFICSQKINRIQSIIDHQMAQQQREAESEESDDEDSEDEDEENSDWVEHDDTLSEVDDEEEVGFSDDEDEGDDEEEDEEDEEEEEEDDVEQYYIADDEQFYMANVVEEERYYIGEAVVEDQPVEKYYILDAGHPAPIHPDDLGLL